VFGIDGARQFVAAAEPLHDRAAERLDAFVGRVAAEFIEVRGERMSSIIAKNSTIPIRVQKSFTTTGEPVSTAEKTLSLGSS